jgi:hypothetical protein
MAEEKNPFAVGVPILLALAVVGFAVKLMLPEKRRPRFHSQPIALPKLLGVAPVAGNLALLPPTATPVLVDPVACTASDAAVAWLEWPDQFANPDKLTDAEGHSYTYEVRHTTKTLAIIIEKGYPTVPRELNLTVTGTNGRTVPQGFSLSIPTKDLPAPRVLIPAAQKRELDSSASLVRAVTPLLASGAVVIHLSLKPGSPSTTIAEVKPIRGTYVDALPESKTYLLLKNGRLEGNVSLPNASHTRDIEIEVMEMGGRTDAKVLEFKSARLNSVPGHGLVYEKPEELPGPGNSKWTLSNVYTQGKGRSKMGAYRGWMYTDLDVAISPTDEEQRLNMRPIIKCEILAPSADELGLARFDCKLDVNSRQQPRVRGWSFGAGILPGPKTSAPHSPGSLLLRVSVQHLSFVSRRKVVVPVDTKTVRDDGPTGRASAS